MLLYDERDLNCKGYGVFIYDWYHTFNIVFLHYRDKVIDVERSLRIVLENRLQEYLKDPYKSGEVNNELRQRLPRAKKHDPKLIDSSGQIDSDQTEEVIEVMETQQVTQTDRYDTLLT